jgi:Pentapeptide repeats (8 copies)
MSQIAAQVPRPDGHDANNRPAWRIYWEAQGQSWRTEPEIDEARQYYLMECRAIVPDLDDGIYPFKDIKLKRADVEWLLATHDHGRGPLHWYDDIQNGRQGLDLRGADLRGADLRNLPLAHMLGGLNWRERARTPERRDQAAVHMEGAILSEARLECAELYMAHVEKADLYMAHLAGSSLRKAHFEGASLRKAHLGGKSNAANKQKLGSKPPLGTPITLPPADMRASFLDNSTDLRNTSFGDEQYGIVRVADTHWKDTNLAIVDWSHVKMLGDETKARKKLDEFGKEKSTSMHIADYHEAVRANRQLAVALQGQGLNEEAAQFAYRAQRLQREVLFLQKKLAAFTFSIFLDLLAGYGYKPIRSLIAYLLVILGFAITYLILGTIVGPQLSPLESLVFSLTAFHGRGFFISNIKLGDPLSVVSALEAVIGLIIEISFIATFTQRFFGK